MQLGKKYGISTYFVTCGNKNLCLIHYLDIMQKNTKVTAKLMRLPAHNVWCLSSLSHESDSYCTAKKDFPLGFLRVIGIKVPRSCRTVMCYVNSISLITLVTPVMRISWPVDATSQSLIRRVAVKEFWGNSRDETDETSRSWPRNTVVKSIFAVFEIPSINVMSSSFSARSLPSLLRPIQL